MWAADSGHAEVVNVLIAHDVDVELTNNGGRKAVDVARARGYAGIVKILEEVEAQKRWKRWIIRLLIGGAVLALAGIAVAFWIRRRKILPTAISRNQTEG